MKVKHVTTPVMILEREIERMHDKIDDYQSAHTDLSSEEADALVQFYKEKIELFKNAIGTLNFVHN